MAAAERGLLAAFLAAFALPAVAFGAEPSPGRFDLIMPKPGLYVHLGRDLPLDAPGHDDIANIGFIVGERCVAVVDTGGSVRIGGELRTAIRSRTALPICYVIDTHVHVDHVLGNDAFANDKPQFVGHAALAGAIARNRDYFVREYPRDFAGAPSPAQVIGPDLTVERELTLDLGNRPLILRAWPTAHTDCDLTVFDERTGTLWTGDLLFRRRLPALDGSLKGWLEVIDELARTKAVLTIPGHGPLTADLPTALARERDYLRALRDGVRRELSSGESMRDAISRVARSEAPRWSLWNEVHPRNVARAYQELQWE